MKLRWRLTGNIRFRSTWMGRQILQVEFVWVGSAPGRSLCPVAKLDWRDAEPDDLQVRCLRRVGNYNERRAQLVIDIVKKEYRIGST